MFDEKNTTYFKTVCACAYVRVCVYLCMCCVCVYVWGVGVQNLEWKVVIELVWRVSFMLQLLFFYVHVCVLKGVKKRGAEIGPLLHTSIL